MLYHLHSRAPLATQLNLAGGVSRASKRLCNVPTLSLGRLLCIVTSICDNVLNFHVYSQQLVVFLSARSFSHKLCFYIVGDMSGSALLAANKKYLVLAISTLQLNQTQRYRTPFRGKRSVLLRLGLIFEL